MVPGLETGDQEVSGTTGNDLERRPVNQSPPLRKKAFTSRNVRHTIKKSNITLRRAHNTAVRSRSKQWNPLFFGPRKCSDSPMYQRYRKIFDEPDVASADDHGREVVQGKNKPEAEDETTDNNDVALETKSKQDQNFEELFDEIMMDKFLQDFKGSTIPSWEAKVVRKFFSHAHDDAKKMADSGAWAWVDDREYLTGRSRGYRRSLDAKGLFEILKGKVSPTDFHAT